MFLMKSLSREADRSALLAFTNLGRGRQQLFAGIVGWVFRRVRSALLMERDTVSSILAWAYIYFCRHSMTLLTEANIDTSSLNLVGAVTLCHAWEPSLNGGHHDI